MAIMVGPIPPLGPAPLAGATVTGPPPSPPPEATAAMPAPSSPPLGPGALPSPAPAPGDDSDDANAVHRPTPKRPRYATGDASDTDDAPAPDAPVPAPDDDSGNVGAGVQTTRKRERYDSDGESDADEAPVPPPPIDAPPPPLPTNAHDTEVSGAMEAPAPPPPSNMAHCATDMPTQAHVAMEAPAPPPPPIMAHGAMGTPAQTPLSNINNAGDSDSGNQDTAVISHTPTSATPWFPPPSLIGTHGATAQAATGAPAQLLPAGTHDTANVPDPPPQAGTQQATVPLIFAPLAPGVGHARVATRPAQPSHDNHMQRPTFRVAEKRPTAI